MKRVVYDDNPLIYTIDNFLSEEECWHIKTLARNKGLKRSTVGAAFDTIDTRTSHGAWLSNQESEKIILVSSRVSNLLNIDLQYCTNISVINYQEGAQYKAHYDPADRYTEAAKFKPYRELLKNPEYSQRTYTVLMYLNDVEEGGETEFPKLGIKIKPEMGKAIVWFNLHPYSKDINENTLHAGLPVVKGEKWIANMWFYDQPRGL
jgi:prolyl 4-hydroxylase